MPVTFVIRFTVVPAERERFLRLLGDVLDAMRHEPRFHEAILLGDPEDANRFLLHETWDDLDDVVDMQLKRPYREDWHAALPEILVAPREISTWRPLRSDRATEKRQDERHDPEPVGRCAGPRSGFGRDCRLIRNLAQDSLHSRGLGFVSPSLQRTGRGG